MPDKVVLSNADYIDLSICVGSLVRPSQAAGTSSTPDLICHQLSLGDDVLQLSHEFGEV
jgi:hypothetical protein